jgi:hypothetical protein
MHFWCRFFLLTFFMTSFLSFGQTKVRWINRDKEPKKLEELLTKLNEGKTNDSAKVMSVYKWITGNISYDYRSYMSGQPFRYQSPELVFNRRTTTCTGYSNLMVYLLTESGIPAYTVAGFTHDFVLGIDSTKLSSDHAWVAFSLNGNWHLADPTWDAGRIGYLMDVEIKEVKKTFWQRLKEFKLKYLFRKKKKKKSKTEKTITISYKKGFISEPRTDYIFIDPDEFLKTHLPNIAHIQMKSEPISVEQYCDSSHSLGNLYYREKGTYTFNKHNTHYYQLEIPERLLYVSDSSLNYHPLNHGDKAVNAYNYLGHFYGSNTKSVSTLEHFVSIADTVLVHGALAIKLNKNEFKKRKGAFTQSFGQENRNRVNQLKQLNYARTLINLNPEVYRKGRDRLLLKEDAMLNNVESRLIQRFGFQFDSLPPIGMDTLPEAKKMVMEIENLRDSIVYYQQLENATGQTYLQQLDILIDKNYGLMQDNMYLMFEGMYLNEYEFLKNDEKLIDSASCFTRLMRDSINCYLASRKSFVLLQKMDQQIKLQEKQWALIKKTDSLVPTKNYLSYLYGLENELMLEEQQIIENRVAFSRQIESELKNNFKLQFNDMMQYFKIVSKIKTERQAYLTQMLNNKYNRSISVYTLIIANAKKWKANYVSRLKILKK